MGYYAVEKIEKSNVEVDNIWSLKLFFFIITPAGFDLCFPHKHQLITLFFTGTFSPDILTRKPQSRESDKFNSCACAHRTNIADGLWGRLLT